MTSRADSGSAPYEADFSGASAQYGIPDGLLREVARQESGFNPNSKSSAGAVGIMQFLPGTAAGLGVDPSDPHSAIYGAAHYLSQLYSEFGTWDLALAAYNAGDGNVRKYGNTIPPFAETQDYVRTIFGRLGWTLGKAVPKATAPGTTGSDKPSGSGASPASSSSSSPSPGGLSGWERVIVEGLVLLGGVGLVGAGIYQATTGRSLPKAAAKGVKDQVASVAGGDTAAGGKAAGAGKAGGLAGDAKLLAL